MSVALNIPLVVFGGNSAYEYGNATEDDYSAKRFIEAGHSSAGEQLKIDGIWKLKQPLWDLKNPDSYLSLPTHVNLKKSSK